jgi:hypothetical protein
VETFVMRRVKQFVGLLVIAIVGAPLALSGVANASTIQRLSLRLSGAGHHVHSMANGESDVNVCADNVASGTASCLVRIQTASGISPMLGNGGAYDPAYLQSAYNAPSSDHGSGKTIAIVDAYDDPNAETDLTAYRTQFGLPDCTAGNGCFQKVDQTGGTNYPTYNSSWSYEIALDTDMVSALCPNCHIMLVEATTSSIANLGAAENEAATLGADVISNSWGTPDMGNGATYDALYFTHPGIPMTAASFDTGDGVSYPAASTNVVAVGGTSLDQTTDDGTRNATETAWSGGESGCDALETKPAWQSDPDCAGRTVADVSAVADPTTPVWMYEDGTWYKAGGASAAAGIVASFYGLAAASDDPAASLLYSHSGSLNDITSGSNGSCGGSYFCTAQAGYDGPTGLGTPNGITAFGGEPTPPSNTVLPAMSGTIAVGATISISNGTWTGTPRITFAYQWQQCDANGENCSDIEGATSNHYVAVDADEGSTLRAVVTATNLVDSISATSDASAVVGAMQAPVNDVVPTIANVGFTGAVLQNAGTWSGSDATSTTYQWQRCDAGGNNCVDIGGATNDNYQFVIADAAHTVRITVSESNDAGTGVGYSDTYLVTYVVPANTVVPTSSGSAVEGRTVTGSKGTWTGTATIAYTYQWYRCSNQSTCSAIAGATHTTYLVASADVGKYLELRVTATNTAGSTVAQSVLTAKVVKGKPLNITLPRLSGTVRRGLRLKTSSGTWRGTATLKVAGFQWYRCSIHGTSCKAITGATRSSYTVTLSDRGHKLEAKVTENNSVGSAAAMSAATTTVR